MTNLEYQEKLVDLMASGHTVLTETDRFAHQLRRRSRNRESGSSRSGWDGAGLKTFNGWAMECWKESWPDMWPAKDFCRWRLIREIMLHCPPPEPLSADIRLIVDIDDSFEICLRYGLDPGGGDPANRLVEWRRKLWEELNAEMRASKLFHPASLPERLCSFLADQPNALRSRPVIAGFEFAGHWEKRLFSLLSRMWGAIILPLPQRDAILRAIVHADREQEIFRLLHDLISRAGEDRLHDLGVVLLDRSMYAPILAQHLKDLFGAPVVGENAAYNLVDGDVLTSQSLYRAALLPLDFSLGGETGDLLFSLLRSPFYGFFSEHSRALSQCERTWREKGIEKGLRALVDALGEHKEIFPLQGEELIEGLGALSDREVRSAAVWGRALRWFWEQMNFPVIANERDRIAWQRLNELVGLLNAELGQHPMSAGEFSAWLKAAGEKIPVQPSGYEDAGIQVIGSLDVRGLAFKRLFVPGFLSGVIPQPVRSFPFLSARERKLVLGGSAESQFQFAGHLFGQIQAAADELVISRPSIGPGRESCLPSPFWPSDEVVMKPVIPWRHDLPVLQRARWVRDGLDGIAANATAFTPDDTPGGKVGSALDPYKTDRFRFPLEISVSALEILLVCPGRFFLQTVLGLEPIPEVTRGLDGAIRGRKIHALLASFGKKLNGIPGGFELKPEELRGLLDETVRDGLAEQSRLVHWEVEQKRLLGHEEGVPGLLTEWLWRECSRIADGWRWIAYESDFRDLLLGDCPIRIRGRLDRLDFHPALGCVCWDYKTGGLPRARDVLEELKSPQLPAYLLAVRKGCVCEMRDRPTALAAGYIGLQSIRKLKHALMIHADEQSQSFLTQWEGAMAEKLGSAWAGRLAPLWLEKSCDAACEYACLCGALLLVDRVTGSNCSAQGPCAEGESEYPVGDAGAWDT